MILLVMMTTGLISLIWLEYHRTPKKVTLTTETEIRVQAKDLLASFLTDEASANKKYVERIIEVQGIVKEITFFNNRYTVLLQGDGEYVCIMCDMEDDQQSQVEKLSVGDPIILKGICKGFLMDAILLNCVLVNQANE
nr:hypothetical protein [Allomuricauda hymeniacidonis]